MLPLSQREGGKAGEKKGRQQDSACRGEGRAGGGGINGGSEGEGGRRAADTFITDLIMTKEHH